MKTNIVSCSCVVFSQDAKVSTQSKIIYKLRTQISEVMDDGTCLSYYCNIIVLLLAYYDWTPKDPNLNSRRPSDFLEDALQFLLTSFHIISVLPVRINPVTILSQQKLSKCASLSVL